MEYGNWKKSINQHRKDVEEGYKDYQKLIREITKQGINVLGIGGGILERKSITVEDYSLMSHVEIDENPVKNDGHMYLEYNLELRLSGELNYKKHNGVEDKVTLWLNRDFDKLAKVTERDVDYYEVYYGPTWKRHVDWEKDLDKIWSNYLEKGLPQDLILDAQIELEEWIKENPVGEINLRNWPVPYRVDCLRK